MTTLPTRFVVPGHLLRDLLDSAELCFHFDIRFGNPLDFEFALLFQALTDVPGNLQSVEVIPF